MKTSSSMRLTHGMVANTVTTATRTHFLWARERKASKSVRFFTEPSADPHLGSNHDIEHKFKEWECSSYRTTSTWLFYLPPDLRG
jgi:hypothetical protein